MRVRIGTRKSPLAVAQTRLAAAALTAAHPDLEVELVAMTTRGDRTPGILAESGGKGLFVGDLERALADGRIDLAVHSAKDMPARMPDAFSLAAALPRGDPRDALVLAEAGAGGPLRAGMRVGTSSPRRLAQLRTLCDGAEVVALRGNVGTRLRRVLAGADHRLDAVVLAMAGLERSGLLDEHRDRVRPLAKQTMVPAAGQGVLALQCRNGDEDLRSRIAAVSDAASLQALLAEREVLRRLQADCHSAVAVHVCRDLHGWSGLAMAARPDGTGRIRFERSAASAGEVGRKLAAALLDGGADELLRPDPG